MHKWEKRWNPLRNEWIVYAAHRNTRPWSGESAEDPGEKKSYASDCYLCPWNKRIGGDRNPDYTDVFVFDNDHPVVSESAPFIDKSEHNDLLISKSAKGFAKVICYDPDHSKTMSDLTPDQLVKVIQAWRNVTIDAKMRELAYVLIFENKGEITGVSNLHPHCQVYGTDFVFNYTVTELESVKAYRTAKDKSLFDDIILAEKKDGKRIIVENKDAIAFIPFFAKYAYEVMLFPKARHSTLSTLKEKELTGIAELYLQLLQKFDALFNMSFPYVMSIMQAPLQDDYPDYRMYFHFQPPLRAPGLKKYLAGPEIGGGNFMADTMPEISAEQLRG